MSKVKSMIAFMVPAPQKQMYLDLQKMIHEEYGGVPLTMAPHITMKIPFQRDPDELAEMFEGFRFPKFTIEHNQFYRLGDRIAYGGIIKSYQWCSLVSQVNKTLEAGGIKLKADDRDRVPHVTIAKSKGKGIYNLPAFIISKKLNAMHHNFGKIKVNNFTICKKTDKGWKKHANIILS